MSSSAPNFFVPSTVVFVAFGLAFSILTSDAFAGSPPASTANADRATTTPAQSYPGLADLKAGLDGSDRLAILEAIHIGLSDAPDGATYMWRRNNGKIAGSVHPTASFRNSDGRTCRFLVFQLLLGEHMRQVEGIACRQDDKSWLLEG